MKKSLIILAALLFSAVFYNQAGAVEVLVGLKNTASPGLDSIGINEVQYNLGYNVTYWDYDNAKTVADLESYDLILTGGYPSDGTDFLDSVAVAHVPWVNMNPKVWDNIGLGIGSDFAYVNNLWINLDSTHWITQTAADSIFPFSGGNIGIYGHTFEPDSMADIRPLLTTSGSLADYDDDTTRVLLVACDSGGVLYNTGHGAENAYHRRVSVMLWHTSESRNNRDSCQVTRLFNRAVCWAAGDLRNPWLKNICFTGRRELLSQWSGGSDGDSTVITDNNRGGFDSDEKKSFYKIDPGALQRNFIDVYSAVQCTSATFRMTFDRFEEPTPTGWTHEMSMYPSRKFLNVTNYYNGPNIARPEWPMTNFAFVRYDIDGADTTRVDWDSVVVDLSRRITVAQDTLLDIYVWPPVTTHTMVDTGCCNLGDQFTWELNPGIVETWLLDQTMNYGWMSNTVQIAGDSGGGELGFFPANKHGSGYSPMLIVNLGEVTYLGDDPYKRECAGDSIVVSSLPFTAAESDTCYCFGADSLFSSGNGFNTNGRDNILITRRENQPDEVVLVYTTNWGFNIGGNSDNVLIKGITVTPDTLIDSTSGYKTVSGSDHVRFENCNFRGRGTRNWGWYNDQGYHLEIDGIDSLKTWSTQTGFLTRCFHDASLIRWAPSSLTYSHPDTFAIIKNVNVTDWIHNIIAIEGGANHPIVFIDDCYLRVDARNDFYQYPITDTTTITAVISDDSIEVAADWDWNQFNQGGNVRFLNGADSGDVMNMELGGESLSDANDGNDTLSFKDQAFAVTPSVGDLIRVECASVACYSSGDPFAIDILGGGPGSRISNVKIDAGTSYEGGQGILLQACVGEEGDSLTIYNDTIDVHSGPNDVSSTGIGAAIYIRPEPGGAYTGSEYISLRDNHLKFTTDTDTNTSSYGTTGEVISAILSGEIGYSSADTTNQMRYITIEGNTVIGEGRGNISAIGWGSIDSADVVAANGRWSGYNVSRNNHYQSPNQPIKICNMRGLNGNNALFVNDTINVTADRDSTIAFDYRGAWTNHSRNNVFRDITWSGFSDEDKVGWHTNNTSNDSLGLSVKYEKTVPVLVQDPQAAPISGADVWGVDSYGIEQARGISDINGGFGALVGFKFLAYDKKPADSYNLTDSLSYNDFIFYAAKDGDTASAIVTVDMNTGQQILILGAAEEPTGILRKIRRLIEE